MEHRSLSLAMRLQKSRISARMALMRRLSVMFADLSDWCVRQNKGGRRATTRDRRNFANAQIGWRSLLLQLGTQRALTAILDGGLIGNDMPRTSRLPSGDRILVLAAHQDDETVGAAGTFCLCAEAGYDFRVVYYTDGATAFGGLPPEQTSKLRHDEARQIWGKIAGVEPIFWDYPNRAQTLAPDAGAKLSALIEEFEPSAIFLPVFLEQPLEHRRMTEVLLAADALKAVPKQTEIWGYQITTRIPGNISVDISKTWKKKYDLNKLWVSQNAYVDYAHLAMGRDIASSYYLKRKKARKTASYAELFLTFDAPDYLSLARDFLDLPQRPAVLSQTAPEQCPPPNFFIVGMQKSGSYWLTALLDLHPQIRCFPSRPGHGDGTGEAHLFDMLARIESDYDRFAKSMKRKLDHHFADIVPRRKPENAEELKDLIDAFRLKFNQYCQLQRLKHGKPVVGEKTTESVHHLALLEEMYPTAGKVCILRDPRDRVVSFHYHQIRKGRLPADRPLSDAQVEAYIERTRADYQGLLAAALPVHVLTYEALSADTPAEVRRLLQTLAVSADDSTAHAMIEGASFERLAQRRMGQEDASSHFRKGIVGDWRAQLSAPLAEHMVTALEDLTSEVEKRFRLDLSSYR